MSETYSAEQMMDRIWAISKKLKEAQITHEILGYRYDAVSILAAVPGQYWEIDVCIDGSIDFEIFSSDSLVENPEERLEAEIQRHIQLNQE
ncbi:MAG: hypothetical protein ING72_10945 [Methylobacterium sp.]|nr:hypothetical protein [Methylobacterium sp.]MCA3597362.1 hypothetical protein [Methylobacterium sp.]MCA3602853.1 hypothetical protein [Methylobacterium sp.]MCA3606710.1 hypothetical protein [Methylobacterium sp.]MCA3608245.1 hypothetical protein [Methylobacterium sp.]